MRNRGRPATTPTCPYDAYLRVYEPLEAFHGQARERWSSYVEDPAHRDRAALLAAARRASFVALAATPPVMVPGDDDERAFVLEVDGSALVCPWETRVRAWLALEELRDDLPAPVLSVVVPPGVLEQAEQEQSRWRLAHPDAQAHILTSTWHVPLWWFVAFGADDRRLVVEGGRVRELVYRTPMVDARKRVARALRTLRRTVEDGLLPAAVETLGRWLEEFHPGSWVELDYAGLVRLVGVQALKADTSAADVAEGIAALQAGDVTAAGEAYARLVERWRAVQALEHAS